ncbi:rhodanese-like domain-containing protein [Paenibacillus silvisoli]|uniref:rhodanese-like domain-containing protein n=1 Tax=Paenibacillus silvisoli TaxID=3110539 RepID=UPI003898D5A1
MVLKMLGILLIVILIAWTYRRYIPVRCLKRYQISALEEVITSYASEVQLLDIRDYLDYENGHYKGSVNISIGRLSTFWKRDLNITQSLIIIADRYSDIWLATRFLRNKGFRPVGYVLCVSKQNENQPCECFPISN